VYVDKRELVTLMTLGGAPEALTLGYLRNQRLVRVAGRHRVGAGRLVGRCGGRGHPQRHRRRRGTHREEGGHHRLRPGLGVRRPDGRGRPDPLPPTRACTSRSLYRIVDTIRTQQSIYKQAGSVHGCALFSKGELLYFVEDVGRHNAVDAIAGLMWLEGISGGDKVFYTTGRLTSEMVIKGAQMGIPFLLSRSGTTQMGHMVAEKVGMSLLARCTGKHFLLLTGKERLVFAAFPIGLLKLQICNSANVIYIISASPKNASQVKRNFGQMLLSRGTCSKFANVKVYLFSA
jgi:FdhD protein